MAHPRKKRRTQKAGGVQNATATGVSKTNPADRTPKSMVIRMGASDVGPSVTQLVHDMRNVMEPHTASRLKERRSNRLRDYTTMAGPLGVTHLMLFSRSAVGNTHLKIGLPPRGPTLTFRVAKYSLCNDIAKAQRHPKSSGGGIEHLTPPLLVMNNFISSAAAPSDTSIPKHLENLVTSVFQSLFPPISPQRTPLSSIRRVLLLNREISSPTSSDSPSGSYIISLRHYAITTKRIVPLSRGLKRLRAAEQLSNSKKTKTQPTLIGKRAKGALPNMGRLNDVADYLLDPVAGGFTSGSESEVETDAEVEVTETSARKVLNRRDKQRQWDARRAAAGEPQAEKEGSAAQTSESKPHKSATQKRAVRLTELGPRMLLRLVKVEEGLCGGKVMWHEFINKTEAEKKDMDETWEKRKQEKEERRRIQRENLEKKKKVKIAKDGNAGADDVEEDMDDDEWDEDDYGNEDEMDVDGEEGEEEGEEEMEG